MKNDGIKADHAVAHHGLVRLFMVIYDDENGITRPMQWDDECEGAIVCWWGSGKLATFTCRKDARSAINVSAKFAALRKAQGKPENTDFTEFRKNVKVAELHLPNREL